MRDAARMPESTWGRSRLCLGLARSLLRADKALLAIAALAVTLNVAASAVIFGGTAALAPDGARLPFLVAIGGAIAAFPLTAISAFCGVALLTVAQAHLDGRKITARQGLAAARGRLPAILGWALLSATVGTVLRLVQDKLPLGGEILAWVGGVAWSLATMFAVPVLAFEGVGPVAAARRSTALFRARWGEGVVGSLAVTGTVALLLFPAGGLLIAAVFTDGSARTALIVAGLTLVALTMALAQVLESLFALALYRLETSGTGAFGLAPNDLSALVDLKARRGH